MNCEVGEIIIINGKKNMVLTNFEDGGVFYSFINELLDDLSSITNKYILVKHIADGTFEQITDEETINRLYPKIQNGLQESMRANGIDVEELKKLFEEEANQ